MGVTVTFAAILELMCARELSEHRQAHCLRRHMHVRCRKPRPRHSALGSDHQTTQLAGVDPLPNRGCQTHPNKKKPLCCFALPDEDLA